MAGFLNPEKGTWVFLVFAAFFGVIIAVNTVFITSALRTHSGVITDNPYEKGLEYDAMLKAAAEQPDMEQFVSFQNNTLIWNIKYADGRPLDADVTARLVRPVKGGHDVEITLQKKEAGIYSAKLNLPFKGQWQAILKAQWKTQRYQTRFSFIAK